VSLLPLLACLVNLPEVQATQRNSGSWLQKHELVSLDYSNVSIDLANSYAGWSEIPKERFDINGHYHPRPDNLNTTNVKGACFIDEDVGNFDATFFNLPAETAAVSR
jgi:hypothetical protein